MPPGPSKATPHPDGALHHNSAAVHTTVAEDWPVAYAGRRNSPSRVQRHGLYPPAGRQRGGDVTAVWFFRPREVRLRSGLPCRRQWSGQGACLWTPSGRAVEEGRRGDLRVRDPKISVLRECGQLGTRVEVDHRNRYGSCRGSPKHGGEARKIKLRGGRGGSDGTANGPRHSPDDGGVKARDVQTRCCENLE